MGKKHKTSVWELSKWADKAQSFNRIIEMTCKNEILKKPRWQKKNGANLQSQKEAWKL